MQNNLQQHLRQHNLGDGGKGKDGGIAEVRDFVIGLVPGISQGRRLSA